MLDDANEIYLKVLEYFVLDAVTMFSYSEHGQTPAIVYLNEDMSASHENVYELQPGMTNSAIQHIHKVVQANPQRSISAPEQPSQKPAFDYSKILSVLNEYA